MYHSATSHPVFASCLAGLRYGQLRYDVPECHCNICGAHNYCRLEGKNAFVYQCAFVDHMFLWIKYKCVEFMKFQIQICSI